MDQQEKNTHANETTPQLEQELEREVAEALGDQTYQQMMEEASTVDESRTGHPTTSPNLPSNHASRIQHQLVRGRVTAIHGDDVFVGLTGMTGKNQGVVPLRQFDRTPKIGCIMDFVIDRFNESEGLVILSREGAVTQATWDNLQPGAVVEARVVGSNKGGLELELVGGITAFMPAGQADLRYVEDLDAFVGQKLQATVQQVDLRSKNVVLSRKRLLEAQRRAQQEKLWNELEVDQIREGTISSVHDYGAFVDLGGHDGLIHVREMSYQRVDKPADVVQVGQAVTVKVLKIDRESQRISLGLKQVEPDPWEGIADRYRSGNHVSARVVRTADFGAFMELEPGVEGLLPISEISWKRIHHPDAVVKRDDVIRLVILDVDGDKRRISLSLKQAQGDPWVGAERKYEKHSLVQATVLTIADYGAFVELEQGVEGLVHISELADRRVGSVEDILKPGQTHSFRVLEVDESARRIRLSLKAVHQPIPENTDQPESPTKAQKPRKPAKPLKGGLE